MLHINNNKNRLSMMEAGSDVGLGVEIWAVLLLLRNTVIGTVSVGLFMGAFLFAHYLFKLSRLPRSSREYRELSYHMHSETLLRYGITIFCLILVNVLFYAFFETGRVCVHAGLVVWALYAVYFLYGRIVRSKEWFCVLFNILRWMNQCSFPAFLRNC